MKSEALFVHHLLSCSYYSIVLILLAITTNLPIKLVGRGKVTLEGEEVRWCKKKRGKACESG